MIKSLIITIKASCDPRIIDSVVFKLFPEGNYDSLYVFDKSVITFGTRKISFYSATQIM